jgi:D-sedoheptulose 7-phosphate isomerase
VSDTINRLYPFLEAASASGKDDVAALQKALLHSISEKSADSAATQQAFLKDKGTQLLGVAQALALAFQNQGRLLCMGNGGSSCDAAHVAVEFNHPVTAGRVSLPAINLTADIPMLTAIGNDVGFEHVFLRQVISHGRKGDVLLGISTSGGSKNLLAAFRQAKEQGLLTIALLGGDGGAIAQSGLVDHCLVVESDSVHRIQETHVIAYHLLWDLVHSLLSEQPRK